MNTPRSYQTVTVAAGQTTSETIDCTRYQLLGIFLPSTLDSTAASLQASIDNSTWVTVQEVGGAAAASLTVAASQFVPISPQVTAAIPFARIVCGSSESSARQFRCLLRPVT